MSDRPDGIPKEMIEKARTRARELGQKGWIEAVATVRVNRRGECVSYSQRFFRWVNDEIIWLGETKPETPEIEIKSPSALPYREDAELPF